MINKSNSKLLITLGAWLILFSGCSRYIIPQSIEDATLPKEEPDPFELLDKVTNLSGGSSWTTLKGYHLYYNDYFYGLKGKSTNPYPQKSSRLILRSSFPAEETSLEFQNGKWEKKVWGMKADTLFTREIFRSDDIPSDKKKIRGWLSHYKMLLEIPLWIHNADDIRYLGRDKYGLYNYDLVYLAMMDEDDGSLLSEYVIWINRSSGVVDQVHFSIKEKGGSRNGVAILENYEVTKGLQVPEVISIYPKQSSSKPIHVMRLYTFTPRYN